MPSLITWFRRLVAVGEPVCRPPMQEQLDYQLITQIRHILCNRWWRSVGCINDGRLSEVEFDRFVLNEKRIWWRWNFGEEMPAI